MQGNSLFRRYSKTFQVKGPQVPATHYQNLPESAIYYEIQGIE